MVRTVGGKLWFHFTKSMVTTEQGKVRDFHFDLGKIYIFERSQGKVKFQVNIKLFILSWPSS